MKQCMHLICVFLFVFVFVCVCMRVQACVFIRGVDVSVGCRQSLAHFDQVLKSFSSQNTHLASNHSCLFTLLACTILFFSPDVPFV
jgi:hypothetical protein